MAVAVPGAKVKFLDPHNLDSVTFTGLATLGLASIVASRLRLALKSHRADDRLELIRSIVIALLMSLFAAAAGFATVFRIMATLGR